MSGMPSNFCPSKARRGSSRFDGICLHGAWLDAIEDGVVPISVKARDFALRIETQEIGVRHENDLRLLCYARNIRRYGPAHHRLDYDGVASISTTSTRKLGTAFGNARQAVKATPNRHDTVPTIGSVSPFCIISAKSEHAFDIMSVIGGKKFLGDRFDSFVIFHIVSFYTGY